jgi:light-regulated signal transduction histidine kinase (bacteriophytochrome)
VERFPFLREAALVQRLEAALAGQASTVDFPFYAVPSGRSGWNSDTCAPLRNTKGEIIGVIGVVRDITEQKLAEEQLVRLNEELEQRVRLRTLEYEEANRELESFSYSVSHDMRAPLRHIEGFTRIFMEDHGAEISPEGRKYLDRICSATKRMGEIIDALLKLSRISRRIICLEEVDLSGIAREIAADLTAAAPERPIEFIVEDGVTAHGDRQLFRVILDNLIGNAWKFTGKQEAARIEFGSETVQGVRAIFVRDNGAGFDAAYANKLFGVFQRLHRVDEYEGTGVGLATVQRLVHRLGGRIWAEGEVGRGAAFYFTIGM